LAPATHSHARWLPPCCCPALPSRASSPEAGATGHVLRSNSPEPEAVQGASAAADTPAAPHAALSVTQPAAPTLHPPPQPLPQQVPLSQQQQPLPQQVPQPQQQQPLPHAACQYLCTIWGNLLDKPWCRLLQPTSSAGRGGSACCAWDWKGSTADLPPSAPAGGCCHCTPCPLQCAVRVQAEMPALL
jgi:hypothetical protein